MFYYNNRDFVNKGTDDDDKEEQGEETEGIKVKFG
jgi:hypothetical protein